MSTMRSFLKIIALILMVEIGVIIGAIIPKHHPQTQWHYDHRQQLNKPWLTYNYPRIM